MATPLAKRRKLNDTSALLKPFKSPLRQTSTNKPKNPTEQFSQKDFQTSKLVDPSILLPVVKRTNPLSPKKPSTLPIELDPSLPQDISTLQRQHTALLNRLSALRAEKDKVDQALKIESSSRDEELGKLIRQWRMASQEAAEEVYADVRDRVNGMGGIRAWQERERKRAENGWGWEEGDGRDKGQAASEDGDGDGDDTVEREERQLSGSAVKGSMLDAETESEGFTMDMMLRTLNVELDVIGYDKENQKWLPWNE